MMLTSRRAALVLVLVTLVGLPMLAQRPGPQGPPPPPGPQGPPPPPPGGPLFGGPLAGLSPFERQLFEEGRVEFEQVEDVASGLGPVFNDRSCVGCHFAGGIGGGSNRTVTRFARRAGGTFDPLSQLGGSLIQERGIGFVQTPRGPHRFDGERVPAEANVVTERRTPPLFGLGLVDAVPADTFIGLAAAQAGTATAGRVNVVVDRTTGSQAVGRFGWKSHVATLLEFSADAYLNELGITNPMFPDESCPQGDCAALAFNPAPALNDDGTAVQALANFMLALAPPSRGAVGQDQRDGELIFAQIGCANCHVPSLRTGPNAIAALDQVAFQPYSDFLLHDMGSLGDGMQQGQAGGREFRTAPLWGLRVARRLLHDGRADSIANAVLMHDGQARDSRDRAVALGPDLQARLLAFLQSL